MEVVGSCRKGYKFDVGMIQGGTKMVYVEKGKLVGRCRKKEEGLLKKEYLIKKG